MILQVKLLLLLASHTWTASCLHATHRPCNSHMRCYMGDMTWCEDKGCDPRSCPPPEVARRARAGPRAEASATPPRGAQVLRAHGRQGRVSAVGQI